MPSAHTETHRTAGQSSRIPGRRQATAVQAREQCWRERLACLPSVRLAQPEQVPLGTRHLPALWPVSDRASSRTGGLPSCRPVSRRVPIASNGDLRSQAGPACRLPAGRPGRQAGSEPRAQRVPPRAGMSADGRAQNLRADHQGRRSPRSVARGSTSTATNVVPLQEGRSSLATAAKMANMIDAGRRRAENVFLHLRVFSFVCEGGVP
jgi:hypothetical protein